MGAHHGDPPSPAQHPRTPWGDTAPPSLGTSIVGARIALGGVWRAGWGGPAAHTKHIPSPPARRLLLSAPPPGFMGGGGWSPLMSSALPQHPPPGGWGPRRCGVTGGPGGGGGGRRHTRRGLEAMEREWVETGGTRRRGCKAFGARSGVAASSSSPFGLSCPPKKRPQRGSPRRTEPQPGA